MWNKTLLTCLSCLFFSSLSSQNPGYLGKHFILQVQGGTAPAIFGPTPNDRGLIKRYDSSQTGALSLNTRIGARAGYAFSRRNMASIGFETFKTAMIMTAYSPARLQIIGQPTVLDQHYLFYHLIGKSFQFHWGMFNPIKGSLAPYGAYTNLVLEAIVIDGKVAEDQVSYYFTGYEGGYTSTRIEPDFTYWSAGLEVGVNDIFFDRLTLNLACRFNAPLHLNRLQKAYQYTAPSPNQNSIAHNQFFRIGNDKKNGELQSDPVQRRHRSPAVLGLSLPES
ncbi:MAG: hypothetical protein IPH04_13500 [Saprospirales bacterium]|nr:hypothetical protein [Saprospirales bacterium]